VPVQPVWPTVAAFAIGEKAHW
jgi:hypothetical protein